MEIWAYFSYKFGVNLATSHLTFCFGVNSNKSNSASILLLNSLHPVPSNISSWDDGPESLQEISPNTFVNKMWLFLVSIFNIYSFFTTFILHLKHWAACLALYQLVLQNDHILHHTTITLKSKWKIDYANNARVVIKKLPRYKKL